MSETFNLYCDESCHLQNDGQPVMVLGVVWCLLDKARESAVRLREIKAAHGLSPNFEIKWSKVSPAKQRFYLDIVGVLAGQKRLRPPRRTASLLLQRMVDELVRMVWKQGGSVNGRWSDWSPSIHGPARVP